MWTARGKTYLNFLEDLTRYLLAFLASNYHSKPQSYEFMNFTAHLVSNFLGKIVSFVRSPLCVPPGANYFDTGGSHGNVPPLQISSNYLSD